MTRDRATALLNDIADAGYSCQLSIGIHPNMAPREHCTVTVSTLGRLEAVRLQKLIELGAQHDAELHLIGNALSFFEGGSA